MTINFKTFCAIAFSLACFLLLAAGFTLLDGLLVLFGSTAGAIALIIVDDIRKTSVRDFGDTHRRLQWLDPNQLEEDDPR